LTRLSKDQPSLPDILASLPDSPGVYLHKDAQGEVLYVGKAKNLRSRVRSYFQPSSSHTTRIAAMVRQVADIQILTTRTETEALILEASLIKRHQPRYNVELKDDKSYPFFKLTVNERFPRLTLTREEREEEAEYFGPYTNVKAARETLRMLHTFFPLRTSRMTLDGTKTYRPCLNKQLGRCLAPCTGQVQPADYRKLIDKVRMFFLGKDKELVKTLQTDMEALAEQQRFEEAAVARDALRAVETTLQRQQVVDPARDSDQDVFALHRVSHYAMVAVLFIRHGRLIGHDAFFLSNTEDTEDGELLQRVMTRLYTSPTAQPPREVVLGAALPEQEALAEHMERVRGGAIRFTQAQRGEKRNLLDLAGQNARTALEQRLARVADDEHVVEDARRRLHLRRLPRRVEAFDISNIQGRHTVASLVAWRDNQPDKAHYRKFRIQTVSGPDDFAAMEEVLTRRYQRVLAEGGALPDLILIDGGKGQVNMAAQVLERLGISPTQVDLLGLAKGRTEHRRGGGPKDKFEYVVKPHVKTELRLPANSSTLHFLQRIRDESHRFAVTYHRTLRKRSQLRSGLEDLPGVGPSRVKKLLTRFGSLKRVAEASLEDLLAVPGLPQAAAHTIFQALNNKPQPPNTKNLASEDIPGEEDISSEIETGDDAHT